MLLSFLTRTFHKVVWRRIWGVVGSVPIYCGVWKWTNFENQPALGKVTGKKTVALFSGHGEECAKIVWSCTTKNYTPFVCYNFDTHQPILVIFGRNATEKVSNRTYLITSVSSCFCTGETWKHKNHIVSLRYSITTLLQFNQALLAFLNITDLQLIHKLLYDSLNLVINWAQLWTVGSHSPESRVLRCSSWTVLRVPCTGALLLKNKTISYDVFDNS